MTIIDTNKEVEALLNKYAGSDGQMDQANK